MPEPAHQLASPRRTRLVLALLAAGLLLAVVLVSLTFVLPPKRICRHFNKDPRDMEVTLTGYSFSFNYGLKYEYAAQCEGQTYSVRYSIVPWGNVEVLPPSPPTDGGPKAADMTHDPVAGGPVEILLLHTLRRGKDPVNAVAISPDGKLIASGGGMAESYGFADRGNLSVWEAETGRLVTAMKYKGPIISASFSPDGRILAAASYRSGVRLWDTGTWKERPFKGGTGVLRLAFSPNSTHLAIARDTLDVWDLKNDTKLQSLDCGKPPTTTQFSPDGAVLVTASTDGTFVLWDTRTWKRRFSLKHGNTLFHCIVFSHDGKKVFTAPCDTVPGKLWNVDTGEVLVKEVGEKEPYLGGEKPMRQWTVAGAAAFSPDGRFLATGGNGTVQLRDPQTGKVLRAFEAHGNLVGDIAFSPDSRLLVTAGSDGCAKVWSISK